MLLHLLLLAMLILAALMYVIGSNHDAKANTDWITLPEMTFRKAITSRPFVALSCVASVKGMRAFS